MDVQLDVNLATQLTQPAMGTIMAHKAYGLNAQAALEAVCSEVERLEGLLSRFIPASEISRVNNSAGVKNEQVGIETYEVLASAVQFSQACPGCFDVTIEPLIKLWQSHKASRTQPDEISISRVLPLVNFQDLLLDPWEITAGLRNTNQAIDLGGIGKGFAGDKILDVLRNYEISSAYSNLGGNVVTLGTKPDGSPWQIGIQHPRQENRLLGSVAVVNQTVVTSGDYQRCFIDSQGKRHHHILNPLTGYPAESGLVSVTIVAEKSMMADALSTIVFVAGMEKGLEFLQRFPQTEAVLVNEAMQVFVTKGLRYRFQADKDIDWTILN